MGLTNRFTRFTRRVIIPLLVLFYLVFSFFNLHTRNLYNNNFTHTAPYEHGVIDDIKRIRCYSWYGHCNQILQQSEEEPGEEIIWHRINKNLDLQGQSLKSWGLYHDFLYVHYSQQKRFNIPGRAIVDIAIGDPNSKEPPPYVIKDSQTSAGRPKSRLDIQYNYNNWDLKEDGLWVKYDKSNAEDAINGVMYLFGQEVIEPRSDWTLIPEKLRYESSIPTRLIVHRGPLPGNLDQAPILKQNKNTEFKILQLSDMHFRSDYGVCKDQVVHETGCKADSKSLNFIHQVMDYEKPQLVVITGDILDSSNTFDYQTALLKALSPMITRKVPFAIALGETDQNKYASRSEIVDFITSLPFSMMVKKPNMEQDDNIDLDQITNYFIPIYDHDDETKLVNGIYILDLFTETSDNQSLQYLKTKYDSFETKPQLSLEFQHYPIQEYRPKDAFAIVGAYNEKHKLKAKTDPETRKFLSEINVQGMSVGYEHTNECCIYSDGKAANLNPLWMCFSGSVGEGAYGNSKDERRVRLFRMNTKENEITSWKRKQGDPSQVFDYQYIYKDQ